MPELAANRSFVEFAPRDGELETFILTDESAASLHNRVFDPNTINFGGTKVHGVGWFIADHLPKGLANESLKVHATYLAHQIGCATVANSIISTYKERMERAA